MTRLLGAGKKKFNFKPKMRLRGRIIFSFLSMLFATGYCFISHIPLHLIHPCQSHDQQQAFTTYSKNEAPVGCFNHTLLFAAEDRIGQTLSHRLQMYSTSHRNHIDHLSIVQFYLTDYKYRFGYYKHLSEIFKHLTRGVLMLLPDEYQYYITDVLASLDDTSHFAFFPENYSKSRFQNIFHPTQVLIF
jgi:hypothetical protein